jgi:hypothetical protein
MIQAGCQGSAPPIDWKPNKYFFVTGNPLAEIVRKIVELGVVISIAITL